MLLANELSPMAGETFAYNLLGEDLRAIADGIQSKPHQLKTKWLSSKHATNALAARLTENPHTCLSGEGTCDLEVDGMVLESSLVIGSIVQLNSWLGQARNQSVLDQLKSGFGHGHVDLVSGGPPCQSFSMAGMREYTNSRNVLPWEFAHFVDLVQPKFALLENVTGILRPFKVDGKEVFAWLEVARAFVELGLNDKHENNTPRLGYVPICLHVNAKHAGVAQNRRRFVMLSIRYDVLQRLKLSLDSKDLELLIQSEAFYHRTRSGESVTREGLPVHDSEKNASAFEGTFLSRLVGNNVPSVEEAIDDLLYEGRSKSSYVQRINARLGPFGQAPTPGAGSGGVAANHVYREHGFEVQRRFRIYQVLDNVSADTSLSARAILKGKSQSLSDTAWQELSQHAFYINEGGQFYPLRSKNDLEKFLVENRTGKRSQRALRSSEPAPAALSIPDDFCHYHDSGDGMESKGLRTLTVREMARIQSFPDNFVFRSKATTGGKKRKYEVPQYTQVGNAVPPLLGLALGEIISDLLGRYEQAARPTPAVLLKDAA